MREILFLFVGRAACADPSLVVSVQYSSSTSDSISGRSYTLSKPPPLFKQEE